METNIIYNENCLETLKKLEDKSIKLSVTSPPYNMNLRIRNGEYCSRQIVKELSTKYDSFDDNLPIDEFYKLHKEILSELIRVSEIVFYNIQIVTGSKVAFFKMIGDFSEQLKDIVIWDKENAQPAMQAGVLNSQNELILVFGDNPISRQFTNAKFNRGELSNVWNIKRGKKTASNHGAIFPEELIHKILINFTDEGDLIYDPFMGTGTTAAVCLKTNRRFIGSEISEKYCDVIKERLQPLMNNLFS